MKLRILSDLHLEFENFPPPETDADVIILAGDIGVGVEGIEWAAETFRDRPIVYVPGNHEYYHSEMMTTAAAMRAAAKSMSVHLLDNDAMVIESVRFLGTTLWTDFELYGKSRMDAALSEAHERIRDFQVIRYGPEETFRPEQSRALHQASVNWLLDQLTPPVNEPTVVVTHHCPHWESVHVQYRRGLLSAAFASDLDRLMGAPVNLWIHGHAHDSFDYTVRGTRVVCNPRGYSRHGRHENQQFKPDLVIEVPAHTDTLQPVSSGA